MTIPLLNGVPPWLLIVSGTALGWVRNFWNRIYNATLGQVVRRISVSLTVEEDDFPEAYMWLAAWAEERLRRRSLSALRLQRAIMAGGSQGESPEKLGETRPRSIPDWELLPANGTYPMRWRGCLLIFHNGSDEQAAPAANPGAGFFRPRRKISMAIWGTRQRQLLLDLLAEAREEWERRHPAALSYYYHRYSWWRSRPLPTRRRETVYFREGLIEDVFADARKFLQSRDLCERLGIPWRRGYLFYGPPGTGKTTLVQALATELGMSLYYLSLAAVGSRNELAELLDTVEAGSILLIEDIDCIAAAADRMNASPDGDKSAAVGSQPQRTEKITASDLLNFIDGIIASQGRLLVMTTNYPEKLDAALVRAGRIDRRWHIDYAEKPELLRFWNVAYAAGLTVPSHDVYLHSLPRKATIADAQALLLGPSTLEEFAGILAAD